MAARGTPRDKKTKSRIAGSTGDEIFWNLCYATLHAGSRKFIGVFPDCTFLDNSMGIEVEPQT